MIFESQISQKSCSSGLDSCDLKTNEWRGKVGPQSSKTDIGFVRYSICYVKACHFKKRLAFSHLKPWQWFNTRNRDCFVVIKKIIKRGIFKKLMFLAKLFYQTLYKIKTYRRNYIILCLLICSLLICWPVWLVCLSVCLS